MRTKSFRRTSFLLLLLFLFSAGTAAAQQGSKVLTLDDYPLWSRINSTGISPDGVWMSYAYSPNEGNDTLYVKELDGSRMHTVPVGSGPSFSDDSRWVAYMVNLPEDEAAKLRAARKPVPRKAQVMELATGKTYTEENAASFRFSEDGRFLAVQKTKSDPDAEQSGTDVILRDLSSGLVFNLGNVSAFAFNKSSTMLAYLVDAADQTGNGLYVMEPATGRIRPLDTDAKDYDGLSWNEEGTALAVLKGEKPKGMVQKENTLLYWTDLGGRREKASVFDPGSTAGFPEGMVLSEFASPSWNKDSSRLVLGVKEQRKDPPKSDGPRANVDVWHWNDEDIQSVQMVRASRERRATYTSVLNLKDGSFHQLATEEMPSVSFTADGRWGIGRNDKAYRHDVAWGGGTADYYRIDPATGEMALMIEGLGRSMGTSPDGNWFLYLRDEHVFARQLSDGKTVDLTQASGVDFVDRRDDHPYEKPVYGVAGWSKDGKAVLLYDDFDIWSLPLSGAKPTNVTAGMGAREQIRFRYVDLTASGGRGFGGGGGGGDEGIDTSKPLLYSAYGEWTKKSGYYTGKAGSEPKPLMWVDESVGRLTKAEKADRVIFTRQTFREFPDYWYSGTDLQAPVKVTDANPQQTEYAWGRRILVDYTNSRGVRLQATLTLPAGYREGQRYPMLVYFYELMSQNHHSYSMPTYDDRPHMSTYASDGYLVLMPDVVYVEGHPGDSAMDCVGSAVRKVIELGYADPAHVGLQGHSWGGYQSSFMVTQTDMFAAVVTGAPPTNLVSFYDTLYKSTGTVQQGITEVGQVRMGTNPFEDFDLFVSQSPIHQAEKITTPFLILHGTDDGSVDWGQGLEYYNAARRLGKKVILLSYPGEGHHLGRKENQKDFQIRMKQYFDHYLKGAPMPDWMQDGVPQSEKAYADPKSGIPPD